MAADNTEELVSRFHDYLKTSSAKVERPAGKLDLFSFYSEIIALKNEVKIESRYIKQGFSDLQETIERNEDQGRRSADQEEDAETEDTSQPDPQLLLDGIIDLYDRIHASIQSLGENKQRQEKKGKMSFWSRRRKEDLSELMSGKEQEIIASMRAGQQMLLDRIVDLLLAWDITPVETLHQRFDPHSMRAIGTDTLSELADGTVSAEIRTGFQQQGTLFRLADVRVNRLQ